MHIHSDIWYIILEYTTCPTVRSLTKEIKQMHDKINVYSALLCTYSDIVKDYNHKYNEYNKVKGRKIALELIKTYVKPGAPSGSPTNTYHKLINHILTIHDVKYEHHDNYRSENSIHTLSYETEYDSVILDLNYHNDGGDNDLDNLNSIHTLSYETEYDSVILDLNYHNDGGDNDLDIQKFSTTTKITSKCIEKWILSEIIYIIMLNKYNMYDTLDEEYALNLFKGLGVDILKQARDVYNGYIIHLIEYDNYKFPEWDSLFEFDDYIENYDEYYNRKPDEDNNFESDSESDDSDSE
jgi:hypothetical protein